MIGRKYPSRCLLLVMVGACLLVGGCHKVTGQAEVATNPAQQKSPGEDSPLARLGRKLFFDPALSASGRLSCSSCHSPIHAYGPPNALAVQLGGAGMDQQGARAVPSLRYVLNRTPVWSKEFQSSQAERIMDRDGAPSGGFGWDGRFNTLHEQAGFPLLAVNEMANRSPADVVARLQRTPYAGEFRKLFGADVFQHPAKAYAHALMALERFELEDASFHPYSSRFDAWLDGAAKLTAQEKRGLALFDDPQRGNCASCHLDKMGANGAHPLFTDFQFEALGVPRNPQIHANADPHYFDEGLCGPLREEQQAQRSYCGMFKTPGLRNVATRKAFFHNGRFHSLQQALRFYVQRDTDPGRWYPKHANGSVDKFDDLPVALRGNVDIVDLPLTRQPGQAPVWSDAEIDDVIAFLETLTDRDVQRVSALSPESRQASAGSAAAIPR